MEKGLLLWVSHPFRPQSVPFTRHRRETHSHSIGHARGQM